MILFYFCVMRLLSFLSCLYLSFFFINCIIKYCCLFCWRPAMMALALPVAFRTLLTCLFIFVFGFCAENKFFFFFFKGISYTFGHPSVTIYNYTFTFTPSYMKTRTSRG